MRLTALALIGAIGFALSVAPVNAAPAVPKLAPDQISNVVEVADGCGRGLYRNHRGRCVPQRYNYGYSHPRPRGYYSQGWHSRRDREADQLNRQERGRYGNPYRGY